MKSLHPQAVNDVDDETLAAAYPWPQDRWLRAMMLQTLDGAPVGADGRSKSLSTPADMRVFAETRRLADAVLIGAQTMRAERYRPLAAKPDVQTARADAGLAPAPRLVIVSRSLDLPWEEPVFRESAITPLVVTAEGASGFNVEEASQLVDVVVLPGKVVDPHALIDALHERGLARITCEGGPRLLSELARADLVDEADITIAPLLTGGGQIHTGEPVADARRFESASVMEEDGYLFTRYVRASTLN